MEEAQKTLNDVNKSLAENSDDDRLSFVFNQTGGELNIGHAVGSYDRYMIWVNKDADNIWTQYRGQLYLVEGAEGGAGLNNDAFSFSLGVGFGYGFMTNVHPYDDINSLLENASGVSLSVSTKKGAGGSVQILTSQGIQGTVTIYLFTGTYAQGVGGPKMHNSPVEGSVKVDVFDKAHRRPIAEFPSTGDTMRNILYNQSNGNMILDSAIFDRWNQ